MNEGDIQYYGDTMYKDYAFLSNLGRQIGSEILKDNPNITNIVYGSQDFPYIASSKLIIKEDTTVNITLSSPTLLIFPL